MITLDYNSSKSIHMCLLSIMYNCMCYVHKPSKNEPRGFYFEAPGRMLRCSLRHAGSFFSLFFFTLHSSASPVCWSREPLAEKRERVHAGSLRARLRFLLRPGETTASSDAFLAADRTRASRVTSRLASGGRKRSSSVIEEV